MPLVDHPAHSDDDHPKEQPKGEPKRKNQSKASHATSPALSKPTAKSAPRRPSTASKPASAKPSSSGKPIAKSGRQPTPPPVSPSVLHARKVQLGKEIFFDTRLSNPGGIACATCHVPSKGFSNDHIMQGVFGRSGNRRPPTIVVVKYNPAGPPQYSEDLQSYVGGLFWDGRSATAQEQPGGELGVFPNVVERGYPFFNPNEMNNLHEDGSPAPEFIIEKILLGPYAGQFLDVYGYGAFDQPVDGIFSLVTDAIVAYEESDEVAAYTAKYDAVREGKARFTAQERRGFELFTGPALCSQCHNPAPNQTFSQFCFANIGVPRNVGNPYYANINPAINPYGFNPLGSHYVDIGLGDFLKPAAGAPPTNGSMKVVTVREVGKHQGYMHNGVFTRLKDVVHFYNKRNHTTFPGEIIDFTRPYPYLGLRGAPLFAPPEVLDPTTLINPQGQTAAQAGQVGNLGLSDADEDAIVAFLLTLSSGYCEP
jgi:cytochrome c peroxidase